MGALTGIVFPCGSCRKDAEGLNDIGRNFGCGVWVSIVVAVAGATCIHAIRLEVTVCGRRAASSCSGRGYMVVVHCLEVKVGFSSKLWRRLWLKSSE
jgi:hypothetical protein